MLVCEIAVVVQGHVITLLCLAVLQAQFVFHNHQHHCVVKICEGCVF